MTDQWNHPANGPGSDAAAWASAPPASASGHAPPAGFGQEPGYGQVPGFGQEPGYGQVPGYGQEPGLGQVPGYGQEPGYVQPQGGVPSPYGQSPGPYGPAVGGSPFAPGQQGYGRPAPTYNRRGVIGGLILIAVGLAITLGTYANARSNGGGGYYITFGPVIYGSILLFRSLRRN